MGFTRLTPPAPPRSHFIKRLKKVETAPLRGHFFRLVLSVNATAIEETGPSFVGGGRYNPPGEFGALYLSESPALCWNEKMKQYNDRAEAIPLQTLGEFDVRISRCLDLTDDNVLKILGLKTEDLTDLFIHSLPRMIGAAAWSLGIEALKVFSCVPVKEAKKNIVIFKDHLNPTSKIVLAKTSSYRLS